MEIRYIKLDITSVMASAADDAPAVVNPASTFLGALGTLQTAYHQCVCRVGRRGRVGSVSGCVWVCVASAQLQCVFD